MNTSDNIRPYETLEEHLNDCLSLLNLFLDASQKESPSRLSLEDGFHCLKAREELTIAQGISLPLLELRQRLELTGLEYFMVILALAPELNSQYSLYYSQIQGDASLLFPSLDFASRLYSLFEPVSITNIIAMTYKKHRLNTYLFNPSVNSGSYCNSRCWILVLKKQVVMHILGTPAPDEALNGIMYQIPGEHTGEFVCLPDIYKKLEASSLAVLTQSSSLTLFCLTGQRGSGRTYQLSLLKEKLKLEILSVDMEKYYNLEEENRPLFLEHLRSYTSLISGTLFLEHADVNTQKEENCLDELLSCFSTDLALIFVSLSRPFKSPVFTSRQMITIHYPVPSYPERLLAWEYFKDSSQLEPSLSLSSLAASYSLTPGGIKKIWKDARLLQLYENADTISRSHLLEAISQNRAPFFGTCAAYIKARFTWDQLIISPSQREVMYLACRRIKNQHKVRNQWGIDRIIPYGKSLSLLFYGPPGTGKTMAAQVISHELGLDLYRIDLSQLLSKYIGETEKNLFLIFEEAKKSNIILFFDEADAVFSKRTEVTSSNDKHSNNAVSYILQKIEEYDGMVILSTNFYQNIDSAFLRRITYTVRFEMPQKDQRLRLWKELLPPCVPISPEVAFEPFAEHFELSGSEIKSILISAAYMAADEDTEILTKHIASALKYELSKSGRTITSRQLEEYGIELME